MEMNKVVFVKAHFKPNIQEVEELVATEEKVGGIFGIGAVRKHETRIVKKENGISDCEVDGDRLTNEIAEAISHLNQEGYKVVSILPIISGRYHFDFKEQEIKSEKRIISETEKVYGGASYGYGYGFSYSEGVTIIGEKI